MMIFALLFVLAIHTGVNFVGWSLSGSQPSVTVDLSAGITASDTVIPVSSVTGYPGSGTITVRGETVQYSGKTTTCPAPFAGEPACFTGAVRGRQLTTAISHPQGARVYSELVGGVSDASSFENRLSIGPWGGIDSLWANIEALKRLFSQAATWDWPMFEGDFAFFRVFGALFTIAVMFGVSFVLMQILIAGASAVRSLLPI